MVRSGGRQFTCTNGERGKKFVLAYIVKLQISFNHLMCNRLLLNVVNCLNIIQLNVQSNTTSQSVSTMLLVLFRLIDIIILANGINE